MSKPFIIDQTVLITDDTLTVYFRLKLLMCRGLFTNA